MSNRSLKFFMTVIFLESFSIYILLNTTSDPSEEALKVSDLNILTLVDEQSTKYLTESFIHSNSQ